MLIRQFAQQHHQLGEDADPKRVARLKKAAGAARQVYIKSLTLPIGLSKRGRGAKTGSRLATVPFKKRRYLPGSHGKELAPAVGEALYQWLLDNIWIKGRVTPQLVKQNALRICAVLRKAYEDKALHIRLPQINNTWLGRWRNQYSVSYRAVNLRYKVAKSKLVSRIGTMLRNNIRLRMLHFLCFGQDMEVTSLDQNPKHFNSCAAEKTLVPQGMGKVPCLESLEMAHARFTAMTCARSDNTGETEKLAVLFKLKTGRRALAQLVSPDPDCLVQCGPKGSYRTEHVVEYLDWSLDVAAPGHHRLIYLDWYSAHTDDKVKELVEQTKDHVLEYHGGGTTEKAQVNDTHVHKPYNANFREIETAGTLFS